MEERIYWLWLTRIPNIGKKKIAWLLGGSRTPKMLFEASPSIIKDIMHQHRFDGNDLKEFLTSRDIKALMQYERRLRDLNIQYLTINDELYPNQLYSLFDPVYVLYYRGAFFEGKLSIAIVGSRRCTQYGRKVAEKFGEQLGLAGVNVISGMALGIDGFSHKGALKIGGHTTAVLGCGINVCYPKSHLSLMKEIIQKGCVISEYGLDFPPVKAYFPMRNRIISALCDGLLLVEAKEKSGSLITVDYALEYGKDVFAIPGDVLGASNRGSNNIVKLGAKPVFDVQDILEEYSIYSSNKQNNHHEIEKILEEKEKIVYSCISLAPIFIDEIRTQTGFEMNELQFLLTKLEIKGAVIQLPNKYYIRDY